MINIKKEKSTQVAFILTALAALATLFSVATNFLIPMYLMSKYQTDVRRASSIGIIGGADGPTAIYITGGFHSYLFTIIFGLLTIIGIIHIIKKINKQKTN